MDAEKSGHWNASVFFRMFNREDLAAAVKENRVENLDKRNYYSYMVDTDNKPVSVEKYIVLHMDEIIKNNPSELEKYPVLKQIYNSDGTRKNFSKLFYDRMNQNFDNRGVYDNYIDYGIAKGELKDLNLTNVTSSDINKFFKTLSSIYRDKMLVIKDYYKDNSNVGDNQVRVTVGYQIDQLYGILNYVNDNYETIIKNLDEKISNSSFVFDFIYDLRDFNVDQIKNDKIKNNPQLMSKIQLLQSLTKEVIGKFNYHFVISRIYDLTEQELNNVIFVDGYGNISFKDYLLNVVLPNMDGHQEIFRDGNKIYVGDIIANYKRNMWNNDDGNKHI